MVRYPTYHSYLSSSVGEDISAPLSQSPFAGTSAVVMALLSNRLTSRLEMASVLVLVVSTAHVQEPPWDATVVQGVSTEYGMAQSLGYYIRRREQKSQILMAWPGGVAAEWSSSCCRPSMPFEGPMDDRL